MKRFATVLATLLVAGCSSINPFNGDDDPEPAVMVDYKARCDRLSAQAVETQSLQEAKTLSARATDCYAEAIDQVGGR